MADLQFTGTITGIELATSGPHGVSIKKDANEQFAKKFRVWPKLKDDEGGGDNPAWVAVQANQGKLVTVTYFENERTNSQNQKYKQNVITAVSDGAAAPQGAPQPQSGAQWDEALERKRAALIASEVVKQLHSAGGWPTPEGAQQSAPAGLPSETYDAFAKDAEAAGYGLPALDKQFAKLFPDDAFDGWRRANAEKLTKLAEALDFEWK